MTTEEKAKAYDEALEHFKAFKEKYYTRNTYFGDVIFDKTGEMQKDFESIFPEPTESEDERIRKAIVDLVSTVGEYYLPKLEVRNKMLAYLEKQKSKDDEEGYLDGIKRDWFERGKKEVLTVPELYGLEKQKEQKPIDYEAELKKCKDNPLYFFDKYMTVKIKQKPAEWSEDFGEEVEKIHKRYPEVSYAKLTRIAYHFSKWANRRKDIEWSEEDESCWNLIWDILDGSFTASKEGYKKAATWFLKNCPKGTKSLHPINQEWSDEDEKMRYFVTEAVQFRYSDRELAKYLEPKIINEKKQLKQKLFDWLCDLRPSWKPSEEQMKALHKITSNPYDIPHRLNVIDHNGLIQLYNNLKKLT